MKEDIAGILKLYLAPKVTLLNLLHHHIKLYALYWPEEYQSVKTEDHDELEQKSGEKFKVRHNGVRMSAKDKNARLLELGRSVRT